MIRHQETTADTLANRLPAPRGGSRRESQGGTDPVSIEVNNRLFFRFFQAANTLQGMGALKLGISNQQWAILGALSRPQVAAAGMSVGELSRYLLISRQNLSGVLARLERDGYTQRVVGSEDRRFRKVRLTPRGEELWAGLAEPIGKFYDDALTGLSFDDRLALLHYVGVMQVNMAQAVKNEGCGVMEHCLPKSRKGDLE